MPGPRDLCKTYVTARTLKGELKSWMREIRPYCWRPAPPLRATAAALLVVDMTHPFVEPGQPLSSPNAQAVLPTIGRLADAFRSAGAPIIWLVQGHHSVAHDRGKLLSSWWPRPILEGTADVEMAEGLAPRPGEKIIHKRRYSGFHQTDLELTLRCLGVEQVVVCGVLTHVCPMLTAFDAFMRGFEVFYPADATASLNRDLHVAGLRMVAGWCGYVTAATRISAAMRRRK